MTKAPLVLVFALAAASASAQGTKVPAQPDSTKGAAIKAAATKAAATKAAATKAPGPQAKAPDAKSPVSNTAAQAAAQPNTKADAKAAAAPAASAGQPTGTKVAPGATGSQRPAVTVAPPPAPAVQAPTIMRETYAYTPETRRDPFVSLLTSAELRPTVADLRLTGILYDESGRNSYATMRDLVTDAQYRVTTGQVLGRMRVVLIKRTVVMFSIEEFGLNRQDSLFLGDTTKVRAK